MAWEQPKPGQPIRRSGKPYIWVTWLSGILGGKQCVWAAWFKAHFRYQKHETQGADLAEWSADHDALMRARRKELERIGYEVTAESENDFQLEGQAAVIAGKADLIARHRANSAEHGVTPHTIVIDGKTGAQRNSDFWQVLLYLFAFDRPELRARLKLVGEITGEIQYKRGDVRQEVARASLDRVRIGEIVDIVKVIASNDPPKRVPSRSECDRCNIGPSDCPERYAARQPATTVAVGEF